jgi:alpha-glucosidase
MFRRFLICISIVLFGASPVSAFAKTLKVSSPDEKIVVELNDEQGQLTYTVNYNQKELIGESKLGLLFNNQAGFAQAIKIKSNLTNTVDQTWQQPWGERSQIRDNHNELYIELNGQKGEVLPIGIRFKVFNDGLGFRYEGISKNASKNVEIIDELTEFTFADAANTDAWWIPSRGWNRYEYQ